MSKVQPLALIHNAHLVQRQLKGSVGRHAVSHTDVSASP
jgi:hypothetical protein